LQGGDKDLEAMEELADACLDKRSEAEISRDENIARIKAWEVANNMSSSSLMDAVRVAAGERGGGGGGGIRKAMCATCRNRVIVVISKKKIGGVLVVVNDSEYKFVCKTCKVIKKDVESEIYYEWA